MTTRVSMKRAGAIGGAAAALFAAGAMIAPTPASAASCEGGTGSGRCVEVLSTSTSSTVVESVPLVNNSPTQTIPANCGFSQTITREMTIGTSGTVAASGTILGAVQASVSVTVSASLSQSASQATSAGGTITLAPGESITCQRTYGSVTARIHQYDYSGSGTSNEKTYNVTVPSSLGVTFV